MKFVTTIAYTPDEELEPARDIKVEVGWYRGQTGCVNITSVTDLAGCTIRPSDEQLKALRKEALQIKSK